MGRGGRDFTFGDGHFVRFANGNKNRKVIKAFNSGWHIMLWLCLSILDI